MDAPISLEMEVTSAPKSTIMTSGATAAVHAGVRVLILPPGKSPVLLSSMTMVCPIIDINHDNKGSFIILTMEMIPCQNEKHLYLEENVKWCIQVVTLPA